MFKRYHEIFKVLERRWQSVHGFSFRHLSGWSTTRHSCITQHSPLRLIIDDRATMQRIWVTHEGQDLEITYAAMDDQGRNYGESRRIRCAGKAQLAQELEGLFSRLDVAA